MARKFATLLIVGCLMALAPAAQAERVAPVPHRFLAEADSDLVQVTNPVDGRHWAAWTWRDGGETDIAIASVDKAAGPWNEPALVGQDDGEEQVAPSLAVDGNGSVYLAFAERSSGLVKIMARARGAEQWTPAQTVSVEGERAEAPALVVVEGRLVLAYVAAGRAVVRTYALVAVRQQDPSKVSDGPDPVGYTYPPPSDNDEEKQTSRGYESSGATDGVDLIINMRPPRGK